MMSNDKTLSIGNGVGGNNDFISAINQLLDHSRSQTALMTSMQDQMNGLQSEVECLRDKCTSMETLLQKMEKDSADSGSPADILDVINSRVGDMENRQKYHEVLLRNQKWEYPAPKGHRYHQAAGLMEQIKDSTCQMRYGTGDGTVGMSVGVTHDEMLMPHWKAFCSALEDHKYALKCLPKNSHFMLWLHSVPLPPEVIGLLSKALSETHFKDFCLHHNGLDRDGIIFSLNYMKNNPILERFSLDGNIINHPDDVNNLNELIKDHPSINLVGFQGCFGDDLNSYDVACSIMEAGENKLVSVDFSHNDINTRGGSFIPTLLETNHVLECLCLSGNNINDDDARLLANALKHNRKLELLTLGGNPVTEVGFHSFMSTVFDGSSLSSAADSNHTCQIECPGGEREDYFYQLVNCFLRSVRITPSAARSMKIYSILSSRNREGFNVNVMNIGDVPVELLPDMLSSIQKYSEYYLGNTPGGGRVLPTQSEDDVECLSIVYELMRWWDKAISLYESLSPSDSL